MPSSVIRRFTYSADASELCVEFVSGRCYAYAEVSRETVEQLRAAQSKGGYFNRYIRNRHRARRVAACDDDEPLAMLLPLLP